MRAFAELFLQLDQTNKTNDKIDALAAFLTLANQEDKLWAVALLCGRRPRRTVSTTLLRQWAAEAAGLPLWLFEDSYHIVGDLAETIALVLPPAETLQAHSLRYWIDRIRSMERADDPERKATVLEAWQSLDYSGRFIFNKLITGNWRVGISTKMVAKAIAKAYAIDENVVLHRLSGQWSPDDVGFDQLILGQQASDDYSKPYPFCLAYPLEEALSTLGAPADWCAEYKWDGIRGQVIRRAGELYVWSRGEELVTEKYPEYDVLRATLPDGTVLDGEIIGWCNDAPLPFAALQTRIGRKNVTKKQLQEVPIVFMAYDILEYEGRDIRSWPFARRRTLLEQVVGQAHSPCMRLSPMIAFQHWEALEALRLDAKVVGAEGLMLKKADSTYKTGRKRGDWWKWKLPPLSVDAVLIYAQQGHGRRANLLTDFTFAVWRGEELVPFTKSYSGLTDEEFREVDAWIRRNTLERFGPVRAVKPELVFEIAFEGLQRSTRHKSGIALRFPRMLRWRKDKKAAEANCLEDLLHLLQDNHSVS